MSVNDTVFVAEVVVAAARDLDPIFLPELANRQRSPIEEKRVLSFAVVPWCLQ